VTTGQCDVALLVEGYGSVNPAQRKPPTDIVPKFVELRDDFGGLQFRPDQD